MLRIRQNFFSTDFLKFKENLLNAILFLCKINKLIGIDINLFDILEIIGLEISDSYFLQALSGYRRMP